MSEPKAPEDSPDSGDLVQNRRANLDRLRELGLPVAPVEFPITATVSEIAATYRDVPGEELDRRAIAVKTAGRVLALRTAGKAGFLDVSDGRARLQVYVRRDAVGEKAFALYQALDLGDWLGVEGEIFKTRTGELSVKARTLTFLGKSFRPLPETWHGLKELERRYRQRYLDLAVNPESREVFERRAAIVRHIRSFLDARGFLEVETPMMQPIPGGAIARPFVTHHNTLDL